MDAQFQYYVVHHQMNCKDVQLKIKSSKSKSYSLQIVPMHRITMHRCDACPRYNLIRLQQCNLHGNTLEVFGKFNWYKMLQLGCFMEDVIRDHIRVGSLPSNHSRTHRAIRVIVWPIPPVSQSPVEYQSVIILILGLLHWYTQGSSLRLFFSYCCEIAPLTCERHPFWPFVSSRQSDYSEPLPSNPLLSEPIQNSDGFSL